MTRRVLITGAGGFLGSHISELATRRGDHVIEVGRFRDLHSNRKIPAGGVQGMSLPDDRFADLVKREQPDIVIHAAGTSSVGQSVENPYGDFKRNVDVCGFVLETLRLHSPSTRFVLLSSAAVYGGSKNRPFDESASCDPISPYAYHKRMCEVLAEEYEHLHGLSTAVARIFSAYGERLQKQVVYDLFMKALTQSGDEIEVYGTGEEARDFLHARDVATAILSIADSDVRGALNVGSGHQTKIRDLVELIVDISESGKSVRFMGETKRGDPDRMWANIGRLHDLGFSPAVSLEEGLASTCEWIRDSLALGRTAKQQTQNVKVPAR